MDRGDEKSQILDHFLFVILLMCFLGLAAGCQEIDTLKRELLKKAQGKILKKQNQFTPRDGITIRPCSLYQTANPNSEIIRKLPAETPVFLVDKVGEWYRVRSRDGREGYLEQKVIGGQEIIQRTHELRRSIEGMPAQGEGVIKTKANFRLDPGRQHEVIEVLPPGKKLEVYERVVTLRRNPPPGEKSATRGRPGGQQVALEDVPGVEDVSDDSVKKDVWYKVKIEDGRVGYIYTHNMSLTPPEDIAREVPFMRMVAWRAVTSIDDPDRGAKNNYIVAYAPIGKDAGCDYTRLYFMSWSAKLHRRSVSPLQKLNGVLPITNYHFEGKPGFSVRSLHPTKKDKLVLSSFVFAKGGIRKVSEEEIPNNAEIH
ncbi:MAG TPA: SH3 domain-containing protein [Desulfomonilaceae bacterium]|nr:SH3 domain-containing protein [Desulfomonilaceae bacterium]